MVRKLVGLVLISKHKVEPVSSTSGPGGSMCSWIEVQYLLMRTAYVVLDAKTCVSYAFFFSKVLLDALTYVCVFYWCCYKCKIVVIYFLFDVWPKHQFLILGECHLAPSQLLGRRHYREHHGVEALLHKQAREKRLGTTSRHQNLPHLKCTYSTAGVRCTEKILPMTKFCQKRILF